jgi:glutathione synthase/RimK-type ligase-like ATP-grasp enzyme
MTIMIISKQDTNDYETKRLLESFSSKNISTSLKHPDNFDLAISQDFQSSIKYKSETLELPKLVLCRIGAGILPFQVAILRQYEQIKIPCINSSNAINTVKDKLLTGQILAANNVSIPRTMMVRYPIDLGLVEENIGFPCVIKVVTGSYGEGVYLCEKKRDYKKLMEFVDNLGAKKTLIVQEYLGHRPGEDLRVLVIGGKVLGVMKRTAPDGDFRANITGGGTGESFPLDDNIEFIALETAKILGLDIAGIDLLFTENGYAVCEANSNPGFSGFEKYCGIDVADRITDYIRYKIQ